MSTTLTTEENGKLTLVNLGSADDLIPIEYHGQRVLITALLAEKYGTDPKIISQNYLRHQDHYKKDVHFFRLEGEEKRAFLDHLQFEDGSRNASVLYLWTEKGCFLHAKSLNTDRAWQVYESLVDHYFRAKALLNPSSPLELLQLQTNILQRAVSAMVEQEKRTNALAADVGRLDSTVATMKDALLATPIDAEWRRWVNASFGKIGKAIGDGADYENLKKESYARLEREAACDLARRLDNYRERLRAAGATKTAIDGANKLDMIEADQRLKAIYTAIVKDMLVKYAT